MSLESEQFAMRERSTAIVILGIILAIIIGLASWEHWERHSENLHDVDVPGSKTDLELH